MAKSPKKHIQFLSPENYIRQKARNLPIYKCLINSNWKSEGLAEIAVARQHTNGNLTFGLYMVDLFCLGVRDTLYGFNRPESEFDELVSDMSEGLELISVEYVLVHNIILAAVEYAEELGFKSHKDFISVTQYLLEEDTDEIELMEIECGLDGKPAFIKTDFFSEAQAKSIINKLEKAVGAGNYDVIFPNLFDDEDDEVDNDVSDDEHDDDNEFEYKFLRKIENMSPSDRKALFMKITKKVPSRLSDKLFEELFMLIQTIYFCDVTDEDIVEQYFKTWSNEWEMLIDEDEFTCESLGVEKNKFTQDELNELSVDLEVFTSEPSKSKKDFELLRKNWGILPIICYYELIWLNENDSKKYEKKLHEYTTLFPDYPLLKIEKTKTAIITSPNTPNIDALNFDALFKNRESITEYEMHEYQLAKILLMTVTSDDVVNKVEAQKLVVGALDVSEEYLSSIEALLTMTRMKILLDHFNNNPETNLSISKKESGTTFQFKIQLAHVNNPLVWRRILMPANATFEDFHDAIQVAFGWDDYHLFMFSPKGFGSSPVIELENDEDDFDSPFPFGRKEKLNAEILTLEEIFSREKQTYTYMYDFGDSWEHKITLEKITNEAIETPVLLKGKGACPPEDCGGVWGYEHLKEVLSDKKHPEHKEMREWLGLERGDKWDAEEFDLQRHQQEMDDLLGDSF